METVVSGIRPTGNLHLGNYFGAVRAFVEMQQQYNCYFFIADWHSLTTHPHPDDIIRSTNTILAEYLACGIDPEQATIYVQSDVREVLELYLYLNMNAYLGELERTTSFKDKARQQPDNVKAVKVPVGKDQEQNMEMARKFARRFNTIYGVDFFTEPQSFSLGAKALKVPGLDGSGKMGKSEGNAIYLIDDEKTISKKVMRAVTDSGPTEPNSEKPEAIQNLFTLMEIVSTPEVYQHYDALYKDCAIRYGDMKKQLAADINAFCAPIRERILDISGDKELLARVARLGAEKARESAARTIDEVRHIIGFRPR